MTSTAGWQFSHSRCKSAPAARAVQRLAGCWLWAALVWPAAAWAEAPVVPSGASAPAAPFPAKPLRIVQPFAAGSAADVMLRRLAASVEKTLGQAVVVDNMPGGNMIPATAAVASSAADGYTLLLASTPFFTNAALYRSLPYDPSNAFTPVAVTGEQGFALLVNSRLGVNDLPGLIALAKRRPGDLTYGTVATGGASHLAATRLEELAGVALRQIPYKGGPQLMTDLVSGEIDMMFNDYGTALPFIRDGRVKAIAQTSARRQSGMPDVPAIAETPGLAGYHLTLQLMLLAPARTPPAVLERLNEAFRRAADQEKAAPPAGSTMAYLDMPLAQAERHFREQLVFWAEAVKRAALPQQD